MNIPASPTIPSSQNLKTSSISILNILDYINITGHVKTQQSVPPTISSGTLIGGTDSAGVITFTSTGLAGLQTTLTFEVSYDVAPVIQLTPRNINSAVNSIGYYVDSTVSGFTINAAYTTAAIPYQFFYTVIQSSN